MHQEFDLANSAVDASAKRSAVNNSDHPPGRRYRRRPFRKAAGRQAGVRSQWIVKLFPDSTLDVKPSIDRGELDGLSRHTSTEVFDRTAQKEEQNSLGARRLSFLYIGGGFLALSLALGALFVPIPSVLRIFAFLSLLKMAGWCMRMHSVAVKRHWYYDEKATETFRLVGDVASLRDQERAAGVHERLKVHRAECRKIKMEQLVESPFGNRFVDKLFELASSIIGRGKK